MHEQKELDMELERQLRRIHATKIPGMRHAWPSPEEGFPTSRTTWPSPEPEEGFPMSKTTTFTQVKEECSSEDEDDA